MVMKRFLLSIFVLSVSVCAWAQEYGRTEVLTFDSKEMGHERKVFISLPECYEEDPLTYFDVIYVFDAQTRSFFDMVRSMVSFTSGNAKRYIVAGIISPFDEDTGYGRNDDLLPTPVNTNPKTFFGGHHGGADKLMAFLKNEVAPRIEANYRVKRGKIAVGHSLGASFILYSFLQDPALFDAFIAVSPNFAYDGERLAKEFTAFDFSGVSGDKFFYISNANEGSDYWRDWAPAREKVYTLLHDGSLPENITHAVGRFPDESHWSTFPPALFDAMKRYFAYRGKTPSRFSDEPRRVRISVTVPDEDDEVYIVGDQHALGNGETDKVKMEKVSRMRRELTLTLQGPAEIKFTRGSWDTEAEVDGTSYYMDYIWIDPLKADTFDFKILDWSDRW